MAAPVDRTEEPRLRARRTGIHLGLAHRIRVRGLAPQDSGVSVRVSETWAMCQVGHWIVYPDRIIFQKNHTFYFIALLNDSCCVIL